MKKIFVLLLLIFAAMPAIAADYNKTCPVLGSPVDPKTAIKYEYKGNTYLLCCSGCPEEFSKNPEKYIAIAKPLSGEVKNGAREIKVTAKKYEFLPDPIGVKQGEKVRLRITAVDVEHGFGIKEYNINQKLPQGREQVIEFTADKAGTFTVKCTVFCGTGHGAMKGRLMVQPSKLQPSAEKKLEHKMEDMKQMKH